MQAALAFALSAAAAGAALPAPGRYDATLCVATSAAAPPGCGAAEFDLRPGARVQVRVADIVYRLHLRPSQVDVATMHGQMQIDEFSASYVWSGNVLRFTDPDKNVLYEVRLGARRGSPAR